MACVLGTGFDKKRRRLWALSLLMLAATILPCGVRRRQQRHQSSTTAELYGHGNLKGDAALDCDFGHGAVHCQECSTRTHCTQNEI
jgi:hypothetical protein